MSLRGEFDSTNLLETGRQILPVDFYKLDGEQERTLKNRIEKNHGMAMVLVHPNTEEHNQNFDDFYPIKRSDLRVIISRINELLTNATPDDPPVFIFEPSGSDPQVPLKRVSEYAKGANSQLYVIRTQATDPEPYGNAPHYLELDEQRKFNWNELNTKLSNVGVTKVVVAGLNLGVDPEQVKYDNGCVLGVIKHLEDKFQVKLSPFTWPSTRDTLEELPNRKSDYINYL